MVESPTISCRIGYFANLNRQHISLSCKHFLSPPPHASKCHELPCCLYSEVDNFIFQREIVAASDEAARAYKEKTPITEQTAAGVWDAMSAASTNMVDYIKKKDFTKYLAIANPQNCDDFLAEVSFFTTLLYF